MSDMKSNIRDIASSNDVLVMLRGWLSASPVERDYLSRHMGRLGIHGVTSGNICSRIHFAKLSKDLERGLVFFNEPLKPSGEKLRSMIALVLLQNMISHHWEARKYEAYLSLIVQDSYFDLIGKPELSGTFCSNHATPLEIKDFGFDYEAMRACLHMQNHIRSVNRRRGSNFVGPSPDLSNGLHFISIDYGVANHPNGDDSNFAYPGKMESDTLSLFDIYSRIGNKIYSFSPKEISAFLTQRENEE